MTHQLEFDEDFPQLIPDPPQANVQFSVKWKCVNSGDEQSPESAVQVDLLEADGTLSIRSTGRNVIPLMPGGTDEDTVSVGAVGSGSVLVRVSVDGTTAMIPVTIN